MMYMVVKWRTMVCNCVQEGNIARLMKARDLVTVSYVHGCTAERFQKETWEEKAGKQALTLFLAIAFVFTTL